MQKNNEQWKNDYEDQGYFVLRNYFKPKQMDALRKVISTFHENWKSDNKQFYQEEAFNSSLITGSQYLNSLDRIKLFNFISSNEIMQVVDSLIPNQPAFMNTQLFFDPYNAEQTNFWHRDCQYDYGIEDQKKIIQDTQVVHFRVPLFDEPGMELVPGSHKRWDNQEEYEVRQEENNRVSSEALSTGKEIQLNAGDLLVFSADMIHRGLYGLDRLAFDILIFDSTGSGSIYADYVDSDCLPDKSQLEVIANPRLFLNTLALTI
ncbi:phytanoyl-CoA dioxygenase family protein [Psychromonas algicola]|uniref:phytanoyl-CoA dioxygenase family protein n=1 Tax=Psychromonas algicola TaxID=2555642 RepID=UPI001067B5A2|nr:phytanoyl-CoA dioxygenase family protein [Psychromonas sp. RZ5]TEW50176.1 hypothetical protein E2R67_09935 [Psychromonas sp. RZ5]